MKGYKGFEKGLICRGKHYAENTVFEEENAEICESGMHFCKNPLDVLEYYPLVNENGEMSDFAEVESLDNAETNDGKKFCTKKLKIGEKISFAKLVRESVAQICSSGDDAQIGSSGDWEPIGSSGDWGQICSSGYGEQICSSGDWAQIGSSGDDARIGSSGNGVQIGFSGDWAQIGSSGNGARIGSSGKYTVICCSGTDSIAKGKIGSWITLSEWKYDKIEKVIIPVCVKTEKIDGERIKEDTFYKLENGEFVEV